MRLTTVILIASLMQVSAATFGQRITLSQKNTPLKTVLRELTLQSGYDFVYNGRAVGADQKVTVSLSNAEFDEALKSVLTGLNLSYKIDGKIVSIRKVEEPSIVDRITARFQVVDVRGKVVDEKNQPLVGASVNVKGKSQGTKTDAQGDFYLANLDDKATVIISFVGFKTTEFTAKADLGILTLKLEENSLEQVQVIAYGEVKQKFNTGNVTMIGGDVISRQPVSNPLLAIQGRIPGLLIKQNSGLSTASINLTVQGKNSLANNNDPFIVIDGVPFIPNALSEGSAAMGTIGIGATSNLNYINPSEIESITVLKDADATSIYGSRAANGAILITTKKGKTGQTKVDLNLQTGWGKVANRLKLLNTEQYIALRKEAYANNNNQAIPATAFDINGIWDPNRNVDWQKELLGGTAQFQNLQVSVSGGSERTQFLAGAAYIRETPVFHGDFSNVKTSVNFNINHTSNNDKFRFFLSGSYLEGTNILPKDDITSNAISMSPNFPDLYNSDGTINWAPIPGVAPYQTTGDHPAAKLLKLYTNKASNLMANSNLSYELIPGLVIKSTFGFNNLQNDESSINPSMSLTPQDRFANNFKPFALFSDKSIKSWIIEPQATFTRNLRFGAIDALLGSTFQNLENFLLTIRGDEYSNDAQLKDLNSAGLKSTEGSFQSNYRYSAIFGRLNYRLKDRYILNFSARRDGSSRFGSENLFHSFYSVAGAWRISEEDFFKKRLPFINFGKLRASYGTTGNDQIGDYKFYSLYSTPFGIGVPYFGISGLTPDGLSNPYLQWEETNKLNLGADFGVFNSKFLLTVNYFRNRSSNQLLSENLSITTGFGNILKNLPATIQNTGWEFSLGYTPLKTDKFTWQGSFNITLPKNKLMRYDGLETSGDRNRYVIGESINIVKTYSFQGVNSETGLYQFRNLKGELTSAPVSNTDQYVIINRDPKWYGGLSNEFSYRGFTLDFFFQFIKQVGAINTYNFLPGSSFNQNFPTFVMDHWKKPGDNVLLQRVSSNTSAIRGPRSAATNSDAAYSDASFARLKNATLSYRFDNLFIKKVGLSNARVFLQGQNLLTITNYKSADPETQFSGNLGTLRFFTLGAQLTF